MIGSYHQIECCNLMGKLNQFDISVVANDVGHKPNQKIFVKIMMIEKLNALKTKA